MLTGCLVQFINSIVKNIPSITCFLQPLFFLSAVWSRASPREDLHLDAFNIGNRKLAFPPFIRPTPAIGGTKQNRSPCVWQRRGRSCTKLKRSSGNKFPSLYWQRSSSDRVR